MKKSRVSPTQIKILQNANGRQPPHRPFGRSEAGGWSAAYMACFRKGWLRQGEIITDAGKAVLKENGL